MTFRDIWDHIPEGLKHLGDILSITALLGSLTAMLPVVASVLTIIWTAIRIIETRTVQGWLGRTGK